MIEKIKKAGSSTSFSGLGTILFLLGLWGCLSVFSATSGGDINPFYFSGRQFLWLMISTLFFWISAKINFDIYMANAPYLAIIFFIPLILVLFLGVRINGMKGWFDFELFFVQPSEIAKPFFVLLLSYLTMKYEGNKRLLILIACFLIWILPIAFEPDWGTIAVYSAGFFFVFFLGRGRIFHIFIGISTIIMIFILTIFIQPYLLKRLAGFLEPEKDPLGAGWHIMQFKYAIARGGLTGEGLGKSIWSNSYLPLSYSDSSFAAIAESVGFIGAFPVIAGFIFFLVWSFCLSAKNIPDYRKLFIVSITSMIVFQAFIHISVNLGLLPPTGITLPILSYGGSSIMSTMIAAGMIVSASVEKGGGRLGM